MNFICEAKWVPKQDVLTETRSSKLAMARNHDFQVGYFPLHLAIIDNHVIVIWLYKHSLIKCALGLGLIKSLQFYELTKACSHLFPYTDLTIDAYWVLVLQFHNAQTNNNGILTIFIFSTAITNSKRDSNKKYFKSLSIN